MTKTIGPFRLRIGWVNEPAFTGSENFVDVAVSDAAGAPVPEASLAVDVSYGDRRVVLPLVPARQPGELRAALIPTLPGTYAFHITGTLKGLAVDVSSTCSDTTFNCVTDASEVEFPAKDPSSGQLSDRLARALPRAERARTTATSARHLAFAALALSILALGTAIGLGVRRGRKSA